MDISYLKEFLVIVEEGRFGEAAERLYTTSSSLSKHIHALEKECGVELFDRSRRSVSLNEYGQAFLPYARRMVELHEEAMRTLEGKKNRISRVLSINAGYRIFELAVEFRKQYSIGLNINEGYAPMELLRKGECEMAFMINPEDKNGELEIVPYTMDRLVMVCHKSHPLAKEKSIPLSELREEEFVLFPDSDKNQVSKIIMNACQSAGFTPKCVFNGTVGSNIVNSVAQNMGISLLWEKALVPIMRDEITTVEITPETEINIALCYLKRRKLSEEGEIFLDFVKTWGNASAI